MADKTINTLDTELVSVGANDLIGVWDVAAAQYKKAKRSNVVGATITGGGTIALGGFTLTVPASMTAAGRNVANDFTAAQRVVGASSGSILATSGNGGAIRHVGASPATTITVLNNQTFTFTFEGDGVLFTVEVGYGAANYGALFFTSYQTSTVVKLADPDGISSPSYIDVTKLTGSRVVSIKNASGATKTIKVLALGALTAFTNPA